MSNETIEAISQRSREAILGRIKNTAPVEQCSHDVDYDPVAHIVMQDDLIENLKNNMTNNKFIVHDIDEASLIDTINAITKEHGLDKNFIYGPSLALDVDKINAQNKVCFDKAIEDVREEVFASSFSVIHAYERNSCLCRRKLTWCGLCSLIRDTATYALSCAYTVHYSVKEI